MQATGSGKRAAGLTPARRALAVTAAIAFGITGCGGSSSSSGANAPVKVAIVFYTKSIPYYQDMLRGFQDKAKELNATIDVTYANFSVTDEVSLVENAVTRRPQGLIVAPMDREALIPPIRSAKQAGIPVITVGDNLGTDGQDAELSYVGQSYKELGQLKAQYLVDRLHGQGQVLVVHGPRGLDYVEAQKEGYTSVFAKSPGIQVVEGAYGNFSSDVGLATTEDLLTTHLHPAAVFFDNDDLAIGGIKGLTERNIARSSVILIASDGSTAGVAAVKSGALDMDVSVRPYATGLISLQAMYDYLVKHVSPKNPTPVKMLEITKANVNSLKLLDYA
jgi:ribose transport system substrate-binding protein